MNIGDLVIHKDYGFSGLIVKMPLHCYRPWNVVHVLICGGMFSGEIANWKEEDCIEEVSCD